MAKRKREPKKSLKKVPRSRDIFPHCPPGRKESTLKSDRRKIVWEREWERRKQYLGSSAILGRAKSWEGGFQDETGLQARGNLAVTAQQDSLLAGPCA